ncbi:MAG: UMP kinase [Desulfomonilaceae bacterium]|nr:UMP kinase [Desulfomonilaceae bacterium]
MVPSKGYRRALVKISGEAFAGGRGFGLEEAAASWIADQLAQAHRAGHELGIVVGGGNIIRGVDARAVGVPQLVGDQMGMIATVLNAMVLKASLKARNIPAYVMSAFPIGTFVEAFSREKAVAYVEGGSAVIFAGGTGNPCFTTDSAAALRAVEIEANVMVKATQVRGVFDKDPKKHSDAVFFDSIRSREVLEKRLEVMDATAVDILGRKGIPTIVLDLHIKDNIARALSGKKVGTIIV